MALVAIAATLCACRLFAPGDSETPSSDNSAAGDPLGFEQILANTRERFTRLDYNELFMDSCYRQNAEWPVSSSRLLDRLDEIVREYSVARIIWNAPAAERSGDSLTLHETRYAVYADGDTAGAPDYAGHSDFVLVLEAAWRIADWHDFPDSTRSGFSFFHPRFPE